MGFSLYPMATFANASAVTAAVAEVLTSHSSSGWVVVGYKDNQTIDLVGKGTGGVSEMVRVLNPDEAFYCLVRIQDNIKETLHHTTRDIFISFFGPNMSILQRGKKKSDLATVQRVLKPFHADISAVSLTNLTEENVREKSMPLSGSHMID